MRLNKEWISLFNTLNVWLPTKQSDIQCVVQMRKPTGGKIIATHWLVHLVRLVTQFDFTKTNRYGK